jgi:hypothetical protein
MSSTRLQFLAALCGLAACSARLPVIPTETVANALKPAAIHCGFSYDPKLGKVQVSCSNGVTGYVYSPPLRSTNWADVYRTDLHDGVRIWGPEPGGPNWGDNKLIWLWKKYGYAFQPSGSMATNNRGGTLYHNGKAIITGSLDQTQLVITMTDYRVIGGKQYLLQLKADKSQGPSDCSDDITAWLICIIAFAAAVLSPPGWDLTAFAAYAAMVAANVKARKDGCL